MSIFGCLVSASTPLRTSHRPFVAWAVQTMLSKDTTVGLAHCCLGTYYCSLSLKHIDWWDVKGMLVRCPVSILIR